VMELLAQFAEAFIATAGTVVAVSLLLPPIAQSKRRSPTNEKGQQR
jgi:hypothetical protein